MRYLIKPQEPSKTLSLLSWLLAADATPKTLPVFPDNTELGLVVAHLVAGTVVAEVLPTTESVIAACGPGLPLGRLYFQVPKNLLYSACPELDSNSFGGPG
ncbi:hypothetical protein EBZ39_03450 [bacterium]|nr:hypothetical protein [bacterium]